MNYNDKGIRYKPSNTLNYLYSSGLNNYYKNLNLFVNYIFYDYLSHIGRALLFRWIYDKYENNYTHYEFETINEKKRSVLHILGWPIANKTYQIYTVENNAGFNFVQTNTQAAIVYNEEIITYQSKKKPNCSS
jgi:hypothetical protein